MGKHVLVITGGGDCPGLNAVIRSVVRRAAQEQDWKILGSIDAYHGVLREPREIVELDRNMVAGIHVRGGTIIGTTNKGSPFEWPSKNSDGTWMMVDRSDELIRILSFLGIDAVISIGGDGSQRIAWQLYQKGLNVIGVPKTIDNDLSCTDFTFGFQTAVEIATEAVDKLVTTAASHNRVMILEVMGRDAGWIALSAAVAGGADVALIPEIPYDIDKVVAKLRSRIRDRKGFAIIVVAEGAKPVNGEVVAHASKEVGYQNVHLGGIGYRVMEEIKARLDVDIRVTVLGHLQRGGIPIAFDRILASQFGVKAVEMVSQERYGRMVAYRHPEVVDIPLEQAVGTYNLVGLNHYLLKTARGLDISMGD
jgi:ATP-dependent phosphofructokinase / diphosphate-dependent phosphofructokinase